MKIDRAVVRSNIQTLVNEQPHLVKNRNALIVAYWRIIEGATSLFDAETCTPAETITREFRNLVTMRKIILEVDVKESLQEKEIEYRNEYGGTN